MVRRDRAEFEALEGRTLFAAAPAVVTAVEVNAMVTVTGTRRADDIHVSVNATDANLFDVTAGGVVVGTFNKSMIAAVTINAGNGHDSCVVDGGLGLSMMVTLNGGNGHDTLRGDSEPNSISGGNGRDILVGGGNADHLWGNNGADTMDGGEGGDILEGGNGRDAMTGGAGGDVFLGKDRPNELVDYVQGEDAYTNPFGVINIIEEVIDIPFF